MFYPFGGDAGGARRAVSSRKSAAFPWGRRARRRLLIPRDEGDLRAQRIARSRHRRLRPRRRRGGGVRARSARGEPCGRLAAVRGDERPPRGARSHGSGEGNESARTRRRARLGDRRALRSLHPPRGRRGRGKRAGRGNALSLCDAGQRVLCARLRAGDPDLSRFVALSAVFRRGREEEARKKRREGRDLPCGVRAFPSRSRRDRALALSRSRNGRALPFSARRFLRVSFPEARRGSTFPPRAGRGCRWRSSRGRV